MPTSFDPNAAASADSGIFGLPNHQPNTLESARVVYLPVPWEVTTSYGGGTSDGPSAIFNASRQVDLFDLDVIKPYEAGLFMLPESKDLRNWNKTSRILAEQIIEAEGEISSHALKSDLETVNKRCDQMNHYVYKESKRLLDAGKLIGVVGGDHSVPFGAIRAMTEKHPSLSILHFDAHCDLRKAYEGFDWSHASIMRNVLDHLPQVTQLTQVGIRDVCEEEIRYALSQPKRIKIFSDRDLSQRKFRGDSWNAISQDVISQLGDKVWISFDIDGLDPRFCPHTGTPVPGGLDFSEANHIIATLVQSGRQIVGFDLTEVSPGLSNPSRASGSEAEWDANVGARLLYKLTGWSLASLGLAQVQKI